MAAAERRSTEVPLELAPNLCNFLDHGVQSRHFPLHFACRHLGDLSPLAFSTACALPCGVRGPVECRRVIIRRGQSARVARSIRQSDIDGEHRHFGQPPQHGDVIRTAHRSQAIVRAAMLNNAPEDETAIFQNDGEFVRTTWRCQNSDGSTVVMAAMRMDMQFAIGRGANLDTGIVGSH